MARDSVTHDEPPKVQMVRESHNMRWVGGVRAAAVTTTVKRVVYKKSRCPSFQANLDRFDGRRYQPRTPPDKCSQGDVSYSEKLPKSYCGKLRSPETYSAKLKFRSYLPWLKYSAILPTTPTNK